MDASNGYGGRQGGKMEAADLAWRAAERPSEGRHNPFLAVKKRLPRAPPSEIDWQIASRAAPSAPVFAADVAGGQFRKTPDDRRFAR